MSKLSIAVLMGGPDAEHEVSLASGAAVAAALTEAGWCVCERPGGNNENLPNPGERPEGAGDDCEGAADCPEGLVCHDRANRCAPDCRIEGNDCPQNGMCEQETGMCRRNNDG